MVRCIEYTFVAGTWSSNYAARHLYLGCSRQVSVEKSCTKSRNRLTLRRLDDRGNGLIYARHGHHYAEQVDLAAAHPHHESHETNVFELAGGSTVEGLFSQCQSELELALHKKAGQSSSG